MKRRNQLLALACLAVFAGLGVLYFRHWVIQKPFGIILFVAEGMGPERLAATRLYLGGADTRLALDGLPHLALMRNDSAGFAAADSAAAATALATGKKVNNRAIAVQANGKPIESITELAHARGRATGLVTNGAITTPTCAAFYAHSSNPNNVDQIANQFVESGRIDIALVGSAADFLPQSKNGRRQDERDLLLELRRNGLDIVRSRAELDSIPAWRRPKLFGTFGEDDSGKPPEQWSDQPPLPDLVRRGIELLQYNAGGYLMIVDAARMRMAAEQNNAERTLAETAELDRAVATAQRYAGAKSTIIVCGDVATGGLHLNGSPFRNESGIAVLGLNPAGEPWMTWATGPKGVQSYGAAKLSGKENPITPTSENAGSEPAAFYEKSALNTVEDVPVYGNGRGAEALHGTLDQTQIFGIVRDEL